MYLWRLSYSLAETVYRRALRRIGSAVDFAEMRGPFEPSGAGDVIIAGDGTKEHPFLCDVVVLLSILVRFGDLRLHVKSASAVPRVEIQCITKAGDSVSQKGAGGKTKEVLMKNNRVRYYKG